MNRKYFTVVVLLIATISAWGQSNLNIEQALELRNLWLLGSKNRTLFTIRTDAFKVTGNEVELSLSTDIFGESIHYLDLNRSREGKGKASRYSARIDSSTLTLLRNGESLDGKYYFDSDGQVSKVYFNDQDQFTPLFDSTGRAKALLFAWYRSNPRNPYFRKIWELSYDDQNRLHQIKITSESSAELLEHTSRIEGSKPTLVRNVRYLEDERRGIVQFENRLPITPDIQVVDTTYRYYIGATFYREYISKYPNSSRIQRYTYDTLGRVIESVNGNKNRMLYTRNIGYPNTGEEKIDTLRTYKGQKYAGGNIIKSKLNEELPPDRPTKWKSYYSAHIFENGEIFAESENNKQRVLLSDGSWSEWTERNQTYRERIKEIERAFPGKQD